MTRNLLPLFLLSIGLVVGCGDDDDDGTCVLGTTTGCGEGLVCEETLGGEPACYGPVHVDGRVFDSSDDSGIGGARIVALDANGGARSAVARSGDDGEYSLPIAVPRDAEGAPMAELVTLRVSAAGYQTFPTAPRTALPIDLGDATEEADGSWVVRNAATDVALIALPAGTGGTGSIEGTVDHDDAGGVLVVAEQGGSAVSTAVSDLDGDFILFNVPPGDTVVSGYRAGLSVTPENVTATDGTVTGVVLAATTDGLSTVSGSINIVNAPGGLQTSVILGVESTFVMNAARAEAPAGLRVGEVDGAFTITDVPPGRYVVLAAFENDDLVRDPDEGIGGTEIVHVDVPAGADVTLEMSFKVTEALATVSPGVDGLEVIGAGDPTFVWADDSSEDGYELRVFDAFGELVHENTMVPRVSGDSTVSYTWSGATLEPGMIYQFRAWSFADSRDGRLFRSSTEDLRGVFLYDPGP
jgi:hypothetical protein